MRDYLNIGPCPPEEDAVQIADGAGKMRAECVRYMNLLKAWFGDEPEGTRLSIKRESHDFGDYYEVVCHYNPEDEDSVAYAFACEGNAGPIRWGRVSVGVDGARRFTPDNPQYPVETLDSPEMLLKREE